MKPAFFARSPRREVEEELRFHLDGRVEELVAAGMDATEARRRAEAEFGDVERIAEQCIEVVGVHRRRVGRSEMLRTVGRDVRLAMRGLTKEPGFATVAIGTLALGVGISVAVFGVVKAVLLDPLPFEEPEGLVQIWPTKNFNKAMVDEVLAASDAIGAAAGVSRWGFTITGDGPPEQVEADVVGVDYFRVLGLRAALGRTFAEGERDPDRAGVAVLSHDFWTRRYGADPSILGRTLQMDGYDHAARQVIGVMGPDVRGPLLRADVWVPLHQPVGKTVANDSSYYVNVVVGRLVAGASVERASAEVRTIARQYRADHPGLFSEESVASANVIPLHEAVVGETRRPLLLLLGAVGLVLAIGCANLANLLLARGTRRQSEMSVRRALGASRGRILGQRLTESLTLALLGGGAGVLLAWILLRVGSVALADQLPRGDQIAVDGWVLAFALGVSLLSALVFGTAPAIRLLSASPAGVRSGGGRSGRMGRSHRLNRVFVAAELALAVVVVVSAGLVARSFAAIWSTDPGFSADDVTVLEVALPEGEEDPPWGSREAYYAEVIRRVGELPGVEEVGAIHLLPMGDGNWGFPYRAQGLEAVADQPLPVANFRVVTPRLFDVLGVPLLAGRHLAEADGPEDPPVGLINQALATAAFPGQDPLGKEIRIFGSIPFTVVGVVGDMRQHALTMDPLPELYRPLDQWPLASMRLMVRANPGESDPTPLLRQTIWSVDPDVPIPSVQPLSQVLGDSAADARFLASVLGVFGLLALSLGAFGVYGVMSYVTGSREAEWGLRLALGAAPKAVRTLAVAAAAPTLVGGVVLGLGAAAAVSRLLSSLLYGVEPLDPLTFTTVPLVLMAVALLATYLPARRAASLDPVRVLNRD